jgi:hypothetical protein
VINPVLVRTSRFLSLLYSSIHGKEIWITDNLSVVMWTTRKKPLLILDKAPGIKNRLILSLRCQR